METFYREKQTPKEIQIAIRSAGNRNIVIGGYEYRTLEAITFINMLEDFKEKTYYDLRFDIDLTISTLYIFNPIFI